MMNHASSRLRCFRTEALNALRMGTSCPHVESLKRGGGIRDYEVILFNVVSDCPNYLENLRKKSGVKNPKTSCICETCSSSVSSSKQIFACLHCTKIGCKEEIRTHNSEHDVACELAYGTVYCFSCSDFIFDTSFEGMRETIQNGKSSLGGNVVHYPKLVNSIKDEGVIAQCMQSTSTFGLRGLVNLRNTCFINCIIQVLTHTPILLDFFLGERIDCYEEHDFKPCMMNLMFEIFQKFYNREKTALCLPELLEIMNLNAPHLAAADQQDAHEFLAAILEALGRHFISSKTRCAIEGIFHGTLKSTVRCMACGTESVIKEPFMNLSLEVFGESDISVEQCLERYTQVELLGPSHTIVCKVCCQKQDVSKQLQLQTVPLILCLHFKRFLNVNANKWEHRVTFQPSLDLSNFKSDTEESSTSTTSDNKRKKISSNDDCCYTLYAVLVHKGTSEGGHYYTYLQSSPDLWIKCDDHILTVAPPEEVLNCQAYMLFYHRNQLPDKPFEKFPKMWR